MKKTYQIVIKPGEFGSEDQFGLREVETGKVAPFVYLEYARDGKRACESEPGYFDRYALAADVEGWQALSNDSEQKCKCGKPAGPNHPCPYQEEINDNHQECNCCDDCRSQCSDDI